MYTQISLNGQWQLSGTHPDGQPISVPVTIPGYVHPALEAAGLLPDLFWRDNAEQCQWPEKVEWTFSKTFTVPADEDLARGELHFGGVDTYADIYLNDTLIAQSCNMFIPITVAAGKWLRAGENHLRVVVHPYAEMLPENITEHNAAFTWDRVYVRRIQCTFFWDWVNRFVSAGIWQDVTLSFPGEARLEEVYARTMDIAETSASLQLRIKTRQAVGRCRFAVKILAPDGSIAWETNARVFLDTMTLQADIADAQLWWPAGYGDHPLYEIRVSLLDETGAECDLQAFRFGIRTVRFECLKDKPGSAEEQRTKELRQVLKRDGQDHPGESYILLVNGKRIFCKGGNWVPCTPFPGTTSPEAYRNLISLAAEGSMNMLRVWGGGVYEPNLFYELCDEYGVMLSHDFMLSCGDYPEEDAAFLTTFREEVRQTLLRLRNHSSIVCWHGNNENCDGFDWDDPNTKDMPLQPQVYLPLVEELDPGRPYRFGSPWGGINNDDLTVGDNHVSWWWTGAEKYDKERFDQVGRFTSESPLAGYALPTQLRRFLAEEDIFDPDSEVVDYHIKNNIYFTYMGWPTIHERLKINAKIMVGTSEEPVRNLYNLAYIQYEWARLTLEGQRRGKWYSAGVQYWMYNDCWPAVGYAVVDYYGVPKSGWYATKHSGAPIAGTIQQKDGKLYCICLNDSFAVKDLTYRLQVYTPDTGKLELLKEGSFTTPCNDNLDLCTVTYADCGVTAEQRNVMVFLDLLEDGRVISRARWYPDWLADLKLPEGQVQVEVSEEAITVTCGSTPVLGAAFDGALVMEDHFVDLLPGETRVLSYQKLPEFSGITGYGYNLKPFSV